MRHKLLFLLTSILLIAYAPACTEKSMTEPENPQTEQPGDSEKPETDPEQPTDPEKPTDPENPENPDPENPDPETPVDPAPDPDKPVDPDTDKPVDPDTDKPVDPDPDQPITPDPDDNGPEPGKSTSVAYDFTAQYCIYCPNMTRTLEERQKEYPGHYIIITLHSSQYNSPDLYQGEAEAYHKNMIAEGTLQAGYPNNIFNSLGSYMTTKDVKEYINSPSLFQLDGLVQMEGNQLTASLKAVVCKGQSHRLQGKDCIVMFWLTENGVIAKQYDTDTPGGWNMQYNHKFLFRKALNGLWGEAYLPGETYTFSTSLPEGVVADNSQVVMLILDKTTKETLAAAEYPLKK